MSATRKDPTVTPLSETQKDAIGRALNLREDISRFHRSWPTPNAPDEPMPTFTWGQLERQLANLAASRLNAVMTHDLVSATRKQAGFKPPEMVLREILCVASALMDEGFPSSPPPVRGCSDLGEAPMS
jgi:hypothetical protein